MLKKVVIIDDNQTQLKILETHFINNEWEVFGAKNIIDAMELIYKNAPDLIITDAIMPKLGGFELLKQLREDELLVKIPAVVYSVLTQSLARLYIKEEGREYFLTKNDDPEEILSLAVKAVEENPVSERDKELIIEKFLYRPSIKPEILNEEIKNIIDEKEKEYIFEIDKENLTRQFRANYSLLMNDEKLQTEMFTILYPYLQYDLGVISFYDFSSQKQIICFDVKNFIFNPILQNYFTSKYNCNNVKINKKYVPNSKTITSVNEFNSVLEYDFKYQGQAIAEISFYSTKYGVWDNENSKNELKSLLDDFFISRFIRKSSQNNIKKSTFNNYVKNAIDTNLKNNFDPQKTKIGMYMGILNITNYSDIESESYEEDMDVLNIRISEGIVSCLKEGEQTEKIGDNEYNIIIFAQDNIQAQKKFQLILNSLALINDIELDIHIGISNCYIEGNFDAEEAEKRCYAALEAATDENRTVIYAE